MRMYDLILKKKQGKELTKEEIYVFTVDVNELRFDICVPVKSVLGEPAIGRRIKADIWLQGKINL